MPTTGPIGPAKAFVLLRYVLIAATFYLIVVEGHFALPATPILLLFLGALGTNLLATFLPASVERSRWFKMAVVLGDTAWITLALVWSHHFGSDFVYLYFFVLLLAAIGENLALIAIGAVVVCIGYAYVMTTSGESWSLWNSPSIIRLPFLFTASAFYGYLVDRLRHEQRHAIVAEATADAKLDLLATVSHEIRTPMTAILGYIDLLADSTLGSRERSDHIGILRRNGVHLLHMLDDILDFSRMEAGRLTIERASVDPGPLVAEVESTMRARATEKGIRLALECRGCLPARIETDATRLRQILMNLVGNAIKFTDAGSVRIVLRLANGPQPATQAFCFEVSDTGIGIAPDEQAKLFRPFSQVGAGERSRRAGGTGLGLAISKRLAEALGGDIVAHSAPGRGSTFTLRLPATTAEPLVEALTDARTEPLAAVASRPRVSPSSMLGGHVLLAEDNPDNQRLFRHHLAKAGFVVEIAVNGRLACDVALRALADGDAFDVVLMDMQMPEVDGYEATRCLRAAGYDRPIVALTAYAMAGDRAKCLYAGCDDVLTKPIDDEALIETVRGWVRKARGGDAVEPTPPSDTVPDGSSLDAVPTELIDGFLRGLEARAAALRACMRQGDVTALQRLAHQLKGTAGAYGFPLLGDAAGDLDQLIRSGRSLPEIERPVHQLIEMCRRTPAEYPMPSTRWI